MTIQIASARRSGNDRLLAAETNAEAGARHLTLSLFAQQARAVRRRIAAIVEANRYPL